MKYFIIAGEASGDLHGSNLMAEIKKQDTEAEFCFFGGDLMVAQGGTLLKHFREMAFMGFITVARNIRTVLRNLADCERAIAEYRPDCLILIDYPGFNLRIAKYAKEKLGLRTYYYVSPQLWAWKEGRIKTIRKYVDELYCILPFEVDFYKRHNYMAHYMGSPVVDAVENHSYHGEGFGHFAQEIGLSSDPIVALLCGSRRQEIKDNLPIMLEATKHLTDHQLIIAAAPGIEREYYDSFIKDYRVTILQGSTYRILEQASAALVTSGTATLETALFRVPQAVCYYVKGGKFVYSLYRMLIKVRYISLVNLIADERVVKELVAHKLTVESARKEINRLLFDNGYRAKMMKRYERIIQILGKSGASQRVAASIVEKAKADLQNKKQG